MAFRPFRFEDGLSIGVTARDGTGVDVAIGRDRRGFSQRDRDMLALVQRHLALLEAVRSSDRTRAAAVAATRGRW